ncbi:MAG: complex I NDUFA9 subunit family protein [Rhodobacteraceae bacterium]|nr:complex I NDUFA9 subunit family protein [Paracoccaceae bacterium]
MSHDNARIVTIFGGSGFVGRYITQQMAREGWRVRVAVRRPEQAGFVRAYGVVGQIEPWLANIRDDASVAAALAGAEAVVNCVGILAEGGKQTFEAVQSGGAARIARLAAEAGVARMVHISAIGADPDSDSAYARTKAAGEAAVLEHFPAAVILRPSIIFGVEDSFFNRFAAMTRLSPVVPVVGPDTRFQPVWVEDVARAAAMGVTGEAGPGIYELGGPEIESFRALMKRMLGHIRRSRIVLPMPFWYARLMGAVLDGLQRLSLGLLTNGLITRDQVLNLSRDNVVSEGARGFAELGIQPAAMDGILETYLFRYRPGGQYAAIKESARGLR